MRNPLYKFKNKLFRDAATLQVGAVFNAFGNLISAALLSHLLGAGSQGQFYLATSLFSLCWFIVNQGLMQAAVTHVAAANSRKEPEKVAAWLAWLLKSSLVWGLALCVLGFLILPPIARWVLGTDPRVGWWAAILAISPLIETPRVVCCAAMHGTRRMLPFAQTENAQEAMRVFLVVVGAAITNSATGPVLGTLAASFLGSIAAMELYKRDRRKPDSPMPSFGEIRAHVRDVPLRMGASLGVKIGIVRNMNALCMEVVPSMVIARFGSIEWVAYLRIAQRLMRVPLMFMQGITRTLLPVLSELAGTRDMARLRRVYLKTTLTSGMVISLGVLLAMPFLPWILRLFDPNYARPVLAMCWILVPGFIVMSFGVANDTFYLVTNTLRVAVMISLIGTVPSVIMLGYLAWWFPETGVAWGLTINMVSSSLHLFYAAWYFKKHANNPAALAHLDPPTPTVAVEPVQD